MRKTSQDGGDNTSITSGVENEIKKPIVGIMKTKRTSIKRKVQNFSHESDDAVIEPLLQKDKTDIPSQSAKNMLPKTKTESSSEKGDDRDKLLSDERVEKPSLTNTPSAIGCTSIINGSKEIIQHKPNHNHMNTNIFGSFDGSHHQNYHISTPKTQILVEIDNSKSTGYNPSPLIFTTAKIHTDGNMKQMEPVQVTPVPILSTIEGNVKIGVSCTDYILSEASVKGNNMINTSNAKSNHIESKTAKDTHNTKTNVTVSNPSYTEISCTLSSDATSEKKDGVDVKKNNPSNNILAISSSVKPFVSVDTNNVPTKTIKSDLNTVGNASTKSTFDNKDVSLRNMETNDISEICEIVDVNKNIDTNKTLSSQGRSPDNSSSSTSSSIPKNEIELNKKKDLHGPHTSDIDSKLKKIEMLPQSNTKKINDNKYKPKDTSSLPACPNTHLNTLANNVPVSTKTSSHVQITIPKVTSENVTSVTQIIAATTSTLTESIGAIPTPKSAISTSKSLAIKPVSATALSVKTATTNVISTNKSTSNEGLVVSSSKPSITMQKSDDNSALKMPMSSQSSKVKSTVSTIISTPKTSAPKTIPTTSSAVINVTSVKKGASTQLPPANTVSISVASTVAVTTTTSNTGKSVESSATNSKLNNRTKTISSTVDSNKTFNMPLTSIVPNATSSTVSTVKATEMSTKATKSTASISKPSTSVSASKPAVVTSAVASIDQPSTKSVLAKPNSSSVKTLITSSDKLSSTSGSVKNSTIKSSNKQIESKAAVCKKA